MLPVTDKSVTGNVQVTIKANIDAGCDGVTVLLGICVLKQGIARHMAITFEG